MSTEIGAVLVYVLICAYYFGWN